MYFPCIFLVGQAGQRHTINGQLFVFDYEYKQLSINSVPLTGLTYKENARKVHHLIHDFVQGETAETWIKPKDSKKDG